MVRDLKLLSAAAMRPALKELLPQFEEASGRQVTVSYASVGTLTDCLQKGEAADVAIVSRAQIDALCESGRILGRSRLDIAQVGVGAFGCKGTARPDISSIDALKRWILAAKVIAYSDPAGGGPAGIYVGGLLGRLGIASGIEPRVRLFPPGPLVYQSVATGEAEIGFEQISLILEQTSVELIAPLPAPIQNYTVLAAGIGAASNDVEAAKELIAFLAGPSAAMVLGAKGLEPRGVDRR
jgi:molybdate transport system substrate-binding protein